MKKQINPSIKAQIIRSAFYLLLLLAVCAIPFALAQRGSRGAAKASVTNASPQAVSMPPMAGTVPAGIASHVRGTEQSQLPKISRTDLPTKRSGPMLSRVPIVPYPKAPQVVLYDQLNNPGSVSTLSQVFSDFPTFSSDLADDFVVPSGQTWNVSEVDAQGVYFNGPGPADSFNVYFYQSSGGLPGTVVYSATAQSYVNNSGVFQVTLAAPAILPAGTYFVEVQANMAFSPGGEWGWTDRTVQANSTASWQNTGGGFGPPGSCPAPGCPTPCPTPTATTGACTTYTTSTTTGNTITAGTTDTGNHCDDCSTAVALPFPVSVYGQSFNSVNVASNGSLDLVGTQAPFTHGCQVLPSSNWTMAILPYQDDLRTDNLGWTGCNVFPGSTCGIFTSPTGTAPNRRFNIEWRATHFSDTTTSANFEVVFYEGVSSFFDIFYGVTSDNGLDETSGVQASSSGPATTFSCGTATLTSGLKVRYTCSGGASPTPTVTATATPTVAGTATPTPTCGGAGTPGPWASASPYPITDVRYGFAQTATHFYVFGGVSNGTRVNNVNRYNLATGMWEARAPMPFTSEAPTCALMANTGIVYCAEGDTGNHFASYNIATDTWTPLANTPNSDDYGSASGAFNGKVFLAGGTTGQTSAVQVYDVASNTWSSGTAAPTDFLLAGYHEEGQYLYVVGGFSSSGPVNGKTGGQLSSVLYKGQRPDVPFANNVTSYRLDMTSAPGVWTTGPAFTMGRADFGLAYDSGTNKLYALGGDTQGGGFFDSTNEVDELPVGTWPAGTWVTSPPNLPTPNRQANQAGFYGSGQIWSVGGIVGQTFQFLNEVWHRSNGGAPCGSPTPTATATPTVAGTPSATPTCTPIVIMGSITGSDPTQTGRLFRSGVPQTCPPTTTCTPFDTTPRHYDSYTFTNTTGSQQCVNIDTNTACTGTNFIFTAAYQGSFDPANLCTNWIGDSGSSPNPDQAFQVQVAAGQTLVVVVSEVTANAGCPAYTLTITGLCGGGGSPTPTPTSTATPTGSPTCTPGNNYVVTQIGGSIVPGTTDSGNHGDDVVTPLALPFSFTLYDQTYTTVNLSSNGNAQFTTTDNAFSNVCLPWTTHNYTVFPYWDDQRTDNLGWAGCTGFPGGQCGIFTSVSGTAPNRVFNIEFRTVYFADTTQSANYELRLYEGQNRFDVIYGAVGMGNTSATAGVQKNDTTFTQYFCNGTGGAATGGQSYTLQGCGTPTPTATATPTTSGSPSATPTCTPGGTPGPWTQAAPVPIDHYGGFMSSNGTVAWEGGGYSFSQSGNINQFGRFDPVANTWTPLAPVPDLNNGEASGVYAPNVNKLFVFGGENVATSTVVNTTRIYDIASNTWSTGAPMPDVRAFMASGYYNGKIYLVGGYSTGNVDPSFGQVWEYDPVANTFNTSRMSMPITMGGPGFGIINGHMYVAGGRNLSNTNRNTLYDYDIAADTWTQRANMPNGVNVPGSAVIAGKLWVFGGGNPFLGSSTSPGSGKTGLRAWMDRLLRPDTTNALQIY